MLRVAPESHPGRNPAEVAGRGLEPGVGGTAEAVYQVLAPEDDRRPLPGGERGGTAVERIPDAEFDESDALADQILGGQVQQDRTGGEPSVRPRIEGGIDQAGVAVAVPDDASDRRGPTPEQVRAEETLISRAGEPLRRAGASTGTAVGPLGVLAECRDPVEEAGNRCGGVDPLQPEHTLTMLAQ